MEQKSLDNTLELKDLVYAPLEAVANSNIRLSANIVNFLASTGDLSIDSSGRPVVQLKTIQMLYEQLRSDAMDNVVSDCIGLEVPLLSIYPLSSLKVSKTKVNFDVEIKNMKTTDEGVKIYTQVCSSKQRNGANMPKFTYEVEMESVPISEGLARFVDTLNTQAIPKRLYSKPVDSSGKKLSGEDLENYNQQMEYKSKDAELTKKLNELKDIIRIKNNSLKLSTGMDFDEYSEFINHSGDTQHPIEYSEIKEYMAMTDSLEKELDDLKKKIVTGQDPASETPSMVSSTRSQEDITDEQ